MADATFYTLADSRFFVGLVALLNSLRLTGHANELVVLDCGLREQERRLLEPHTTLVALPAELAARTVLAKPFLATLRPTGTIAWIDSDVIVTGSLSAILERADAGKICLYPVDWPALRRRRFAEWQQTFGLSAPPRDQTYMNAGFLALSAERWRPMLEHWWQACETIPFERVFGPKVDDPLWSGDQDVLNALLMSEVPPEAIEELPQTEVVFPPDMNRAEVVDAKAVSVALDGAPARLLHYTWVPKPWTGQAWGRIDMHRDAYARLLPRLLFGEDVVLRLEPAAVPPWLRPGVTGRLSLAAIALGKQARRGAGAVVRRLPHPLRRRMFAWRERVEPRERIPGELRDGAEVE